MKKFITLFFLGLLFALSASAGSTAPLPVKLNNSSDSFTNPMLKENRTPLEFIQIRGESRPNVKITGFTRNEAGIIRDMQSATEAMKTRVNAGVEKTYTVKLNVDIEGFPYLDNVISTMGMLVNKATGETSYFEKTTRPWFFDSPMVCEDVPAGAYVACVAINVPRNDYSEDGKEWDTYVLNHADVTVSENSDNFVTVKMSEAVNCYEYRALNDEGKQFPYAEVPDNWDDYVKPDESGFTSPSLDFGYCGLEVLNFDNYRVLFMGPDLDARGSFACYGSDCFQTSPVYYLFNMSKKGPISGDFVLSNNPADYKIYNARFLLTPEDMECPVQGAGYTNWSLYRTDEGLQFNYASGCGGAWSDGPFNRADLRVCWQDDNPDIYLNGWSPLTRTKWDAENMTGDLKQAGVYVTDSDGNTVITGPSYYKQENGKYTFLSPIEIFNLNPDKIDIVNFRQSLFLSGNIIWYFGDDGCVWGMWPNVLPTGFYHESIIIDDRTRFYGETRLNGQVIDFSSLYFNKFEPGDFVEFDLSYDNVMVEEKMSTEAHLTIGTKFGGDDFEAPYLTDFMVARPDGTPTCRVPIDEADGASIHLIAKDDECTDITVNVALAEQESNEWTEANVIGRKINDQLGSYIKVSLSDLAHDKWYKVKVKVTDVSGNYCEAIVNYAFIVTNDTGIDTVSPDGQTDAQPVYFNMQGIRVQNPTQGLYIRKQGSKITKILLN